MDDGLNPKDDGFLSRWSRRKAHSQQGVVREAASARAPEVQVGQGLPSKELPVQELPLNTPSPDIAKPESEPEPLGPTLGDVEQLDASSDYRAFVGRDVDPQVRNAAFKKMFHSDPHFNVMDGLDVYIDDYNTPQPLPVAVMKTLLQARALGLIDDELKEQELPAAASPVSQTLHQQEGQRVGEQTSEQAIEQACEHASKQAPTPALSQTSSTEELSAAEAPPAVAGTVVPFPRRPGSEDPA